MSQNIEFYLNPSSPVQKTKKCHLPPVSSLLLSPSATETDLPRLTLEIPSPSLSSSSSLSGPSSSITISPLLPPFTNTLSPIDSLSSPQTSPIPAFLLHPAATPYIRCRSLSNASNNSTAHQDTFTNLPIQTTEVKRKRGRPPNSPSKVKHQHWTFVAPTICDIQQQTIQALADKQQRQQEEEEEGQFTVLHWPTNQSHITNYTAIPKKKRGRKPKAQVPGNFCFIWRDLTGRRGENKKKKPLPL